MAKNSEFVQGYAESLFALAELEGVADILADQLFELSKGMTANPDLRQFLADAGIPAAEKKKAVGEIFSRDASPLMRGYVEILIDINKAELVGDIAHAYVVFSEKQKSQVLAEVTSAVALSDELTEKLTAELNKATGKKVTVKNFVDGAILGGLVIKVEDKIMDLSIRGKLADLRSSLLAS